MLQDTGQSCNKTPGVLTIGFQEHTPKIFEAIQQFFRQLNLWFAAHQNGMALLNESSSFSAVLKGRSAGWML